MQDEGVYSQHCMQFSYVHDSVLTSAVSLLTNHLLV